MHPPGSSAEPTVTDLELLGLENWPVAPALVRRRYRQLLKHLHPDLNPDRRAWAAARTREVIEAGRRLIRASDQRKAWRPEADGPSESTESEAGAATGLRVIVLKAEGQTFAVPVGCLEGVLASDAIRRSLFGHYVRHGAECLPVETLQGTHFRPGTAAAVLVIRHGPGALTAVAVPGPFRQERTALVEDREVIRHPDGRREVMLGAEGRAVPLLPGSRPSTHLTSASSSPTWSR